MKRDRRKQKPRYQAWLIAAIVLLMVIGGLVFIALSVSVITVPDSLVALFAPWTKEVQADWNGSGTLVGHHEAGDPMVRHKGWTRGSLPPAGPFGTGRCIVVYLPPNYNPDRTEAYPILYAFHGFGNRPDVWVKSLPNLVEQAIEEGIMPATVIVMPDFSISGNGSVEGSWPGDGRAGSWYVNSNLGAYADYFFNTLRPWIHSKYNVRIDPAGSAAIGTSMGGYAALYYSITRQDFVSTIAAIYPKADLRYAVSGSRLAPYDPDKYSPITKDRPRRAMMALDGFGLFGVAENFFIGQAFAVNASKEYNGPIWQDDMPVWKRMQSVNPVDVLMEERPNLKNKSYLISSGDMDEFNFHSHLPTIVPVLEKFGANVHSELLPGLDHGWWGEGNEGERKRVIKWLGERLKEAEIKSSVDKS